MASSKHTFSLEIDTTIVKNPICMYRFLLFFWKMVEMLFLQGEHIFLENLTNTEFQDFYILLYWGDKGFGLSEFFH